MDEAVMWGILVVFACVCCFVLGTFVGGSWTIETGTTLKATNENELPYKWECKHRFCTLSVSSSEEAFVKDWAADHERTSHGV